MNWELGRPAKVIDSSMDRWLKERSMKRFLALTVVLTAVTGLTLCFAGTERYSSKEVAPPPAVCDWSGFYIGLNVGVAGLQADVTDRNFWDNGATTRLEDTNFLGGGQAGYNWQKGSFVFGLEVNADYVNTDKSFNQNSEERFKGKVDFQGSLRARGGIAVDNALIYATSGVALSHGGTEFKEFNEGEVGNQELARQDEWQAGFVAGVGVEYKFNCHWSARMEALYTHYPESTNGIEPFNSQVPPTSRFDFGFQNDIYSVTLGVNYLFGGGH
jgi:outer membrane immunogenic protein